MSAPHYTEYHPRWYRKRVSTYWWLGRWPYLRFILRELTSLAVAYSVVLTLVQICALRAGPESYAQLQQFLRNPIIVVVNLLALAFALFHTITWFNLAPSAMAVRFRGRRLPDAAVAAPNYVAWAVVTAFVIWTVVRQ
ncbi:MAG TPA: hypothetical protein VNK82_03410 [Terriglobales bacterium]|nr:hypothetical protein [Terriglobales bacterium]